jgi:hypothetical protein
MRSVDLNAGQRCSVAATASLECFELVEVLEKHAVQVGLVPLDVLDGAGGEDAVEPGVSAVEAATESGELLEVQLGGPKGVALKTDQAVETPESESDAVSKDQLQVSDGLESRDLTGEMVFPVGRLLDFRENRAGGEDAMAEGVQRGRNAGLGGPPTAPRRGEKGWASGWIGHYQVTSRRVWGNDRKS